MTEPIAGLGMSPLEILVVLAAVALACARWAPAWARRPVTIAAMAAVMLSGTVSVVQGARWQLLAVLAGAAIAAPFAVASVSRRPTRRPEPGPTGRPESRPTGRPESRPTGRPEPRPRRWPAAVGTAACLCLVAAGAVAAWALPVPVFPEPSGRYTVGTTVMQWTDAARPETATARPDDRRTVVVQVWYPARDDPADTRRARYLGRTEREARVVARGLAGYLGVPGLLLDGASRARTRSVAGAAVAGTGERFPLVLFSPGLGGVRTQNTAWAEELASRGYVVAGLDHPYDSAGVVLDDGRTISTRISATGDPAEDERRAIGWTAVRATDLSFALTEFGRLDQGRIPGPLTGRLDMSRTAATGHSLGGAAALLAARQDRRFGAVINLDGFPRDPAPRPFPQPVLALTAPVAPGENPAYLPRLTEVLRLSTAGGHHLTVPGAAHLTFTDAPLYLPPVPGLAGSLGRAGGPRVTAAASAAFLDMTLRGRTGDLAARLAQYGELTAYHAGKQDAADRKSGRTISPSPSPSPPPSPKAGE